MLDSNGTTAEHVAEVPIPEKKQRRRYVVDVVGGTVMTQTGHICTLSDLNEDVIRVLALKHIAAILQRAPDEAVEIENLIHGQTRLRKPKPPAELDSWRLAFAHALVEATKKAEAPHTIDTAKTIARGMEREKITLAKRDPLVVKHHARITNNVGGVMALIG